MRTPTIAQLRNGPPSIGLMTAAAALGIGRTKAYDMAKRGQFPIAVLRIGDVYRVRTADLLTFLGISEAPPVPAHPRPPSPRPY